jgi:hypothetical protein
MACEVSLTLSDDEGVIEFIDAGEGNVLIAGFKPNTPTGDEAQVEVVLSPSSVAALTTFLDRINLENQS